jgi:hypothetical protein
MKGRIFFSIIITILMIVFSLSGCDTEIQDNSIESPFEGTWEVDGVPDLRLVFEDNSWITIEDDRPQNKGTFTYADNKIELLLTHTNLSLNDNETSVNWEDVTIGMSPDYIPANLFRCTISKDRLEFQEVLSDYLYLFGVRFFWTNEMIDGYFTGNLLGVSFVKSTPNPVFKSQTWETLNNLQNFGLIGTTVISSNSSVAVVEIAGNMIGIDSVGKGSTEILIQDNDGHEALIYVNILSTGSIRAYVDKCERLITLTIEYTIAANGEYDGGNGSFVSSSFEGGYNYVGEQFGRTPMGDWHWGALVQEMRENGCDIPEPDAYIPDFIRIWNFSVDSVEGGPVSWNLTGRPAVSNIITKEHVTMKING